MKLHSAFHIGSCWKIQDRRQKHSETQTKHNPEKKQTAQNTAKQNHPGSVGQETRWAYSTMLSSPHKEHYY